MEGERLIDIDLGYNLISIIFLCAAIVFAAISVLLFIRLRIREVFNFLTGRTQKMTIEKIDAEHVRKGKAKAGSKKLASQPVSEKDMQDGAAQEDAADPKQEDIPGSLPDETVYHETGLLLASGTEAGPADPHAGLQADGGEQKEEGRLSYSGRHELKGPFHIEESMDAGSVSAAPADTGYASGAAADFSQASAASADTGAQDGTAAVCDPEAVHKPQTRGEETDIPQTGGEETDVQPTGTEATDILQTGDEATDVLQTGDEETDILQTGDEETGILSAGGVQGASPPPEMFVVIRSCMVIHTEERIEA